MVNTAQVSYWDGTALRTSFSNTAVVAITSAVTPTVDPLSPPNMSGIDGKTYTETDRIDFSYAVSGASFQWVFTAISLQGHLSGSMRGSTFGAADALATTSVPSLQISQFALRPGAYRLTVTATKDGQSQSAEASITVVAANLSTVRIYPNPWRSDVHAAHPSITFSGLTVGTTVRLFTVAGRQATVLHSDGPSLMWDMTDDSGTKVSSGIYLYLISDAQGDKMKGKLAIIK